MIQRVKGFFGRVYRYASAFVRRTVLPFASFVRRRYKPILLALGCLSLALQVTGIAWGLASLHRAVFTPRTIKGMDVSNYQGSINWKKTAASNISFVYIKATEGRKFRDARFAVNWKNAARAGIPAGAYHFFVLTSTGEEQARNFIAAVPKEGGRLPPAVDVEVPLTDVPALETQLNRYISLVSSHYGVKPVLYFSKKVYAAIGKDYAAYPRWAVSYSAKPAAGWTFWQYSETGKVKGVAGNVDLDLYYGSLWDFRGLLS